MNSKDDTGAPKPHIADLPIEEIQRKAGEATRNVARKAVAAGRTVTGMKDGKIVTFRVAEQDAIDRLQATAAEFFDAILGLNLAECMVTDLSWLSDFSSCGLPRDMVTKEMRLPEVYAVWDEWVKKAIVVRYGVVLKTTKLPLTDIFEQIVQQSTPAKEIRNENGSL